MTTMFDIGDKITFTGTGKVVDYHISEHGDCYTIKLTGLSKKVNQDATIYVSSHDLLMMGADLQYEEENK